MSEAPQWSGLLGAYRGMTSGRPPGGGRLHLALDLAGSQQLDRELLAHFGRHAPAELRGGADKR